MSHRATSLSFQSHPLFPKLLIYFASISNEWVIYDNVFCDWFLSLGIMFSSCFHVSACILLTTQYYSPMLCGHMSVHIFMGPLWIFYLPTHTRPSTPTARPGGQSQRKDPSLLIQCPFMQMPGVWHSSTSAQRVTEARLLLSLRSFATALHYQPFNFIIHGRIHKYDSESCV